MIKERWNSLSNNKVLIYKHLFFSKNALIFQHFPAFLLHVDIPSSFKSFPGFYRKIPIKKWKKSQYAWLLLLSIRFSAFLLPFFIIPYFFFFVFFFFCGKLTSFPHISPLFFTFFVFAEMKEIFISKWVEISKMK